MPINNIPRGGEPDSPAALIRSASDAIRYSPGADTQLSDILSSRLLLLTPSLAAVVEALADIDLLASKRAAEE